MFVGYRIVAGFVIERIMFVIGGMAAPEATPEPAYSSCWREATMADIAAWLSDSAGMPPARATVTIC